MHVCWFICMYVCVYACMDVCICVEVQYVCISTSTIIIHIVQLRTIKIIEKGMAETYGTKGTTHFVIWSRLHCNFWVEISELYPQGYIYKCMRMYIYIHVYVKPYVVMPWRREIQPTCHMCKCISISMDIHIYICIYVSSLALLPARMIVQHQTVVIWATSIWTLITSDSFPMSSGMQLGKRTDYSLNDPSILWIMTFM